VSESDTTRDARLSDALDALRAAILWLHGDHRDTPRSQFNGDAWYRKARSGVVGLRAALTTTDSGEQPGLDVERLAEAVFQTGVSWSRDATASLPDNTPGGAVLARTLAVDIAAHYDRLATPTRDAP
jgi:hypothetical protein